MNRYDKKIYTSSSTSSFFFKKKDKFFYMQNDYFSLRSHIMNVMKINNLQRKKKWIIFLF